ncbi:hypothetical protein RSAG8_11493, partial [Rhizoctonia solani AG-8 WAC10335]
MPKSSKQKPATQPKSSKPALSSAAKAAQRERVTEYENAKASTVALSVKGKGVRYYDDDDDGNNSNEDDQDDDKGEGSEEGEDDGGDEEMDEDEEPESRYQPYKSKCRNFIHIPNENGDYTDYSMLDRPKGKLKNLPKLMEMDGPENKEILHGIKSTVRTIARHVARDIPNCSYPMLSDEQKGTIQYLARKKYPILGLFRRDWVSKELSIRALTNQRDHKAHIQKAGGQAAWCTSLKEKREKEGKVAGDTMSAKGKGKSRSEPDPSDRDEGSSKVSNKPPHDIIQGTDDEAETASIPEPSTSKRKIHMTTRYSLEYTLTSKRKVIRHAYNSDDEAEAEAASIPQSSSSRPRPKLRPKVIRRMEDSEDEANDEPDSEPEPKSKSSSSKTPTPPPITSKRKAQGEVSDHPQKTMRTQPIEGSEDGIDDGDKLEQAHPASPPADTPPIDDESPIGRKAAPSSITGKRNPTTKSTSDKTSGNGKDKGGSKTKRTPKSSGLVLQSPAPNAIASGSGTTQETRSKAKKGGRGRQAKQELIDEADSMLGTPTPASTQRVTRQGLKRAQA